MRPWRQADSQWNANSVTAGRERSRPAHRSVGGIAAGMAVELQSGSGARQLIWACFWLGMP
eukprot:2784764-Lingulodinium_polyedra.AAC.1